VASEGGERVLASLDKLDQLREHLRRIGGPER